MSCHVKCDPNYAKHLVLCIGMLISGAIRSRLIINMPSCHKNQTGSTLIVSQKINSFVIISAEASKMYFVTHDYIHIQANRLFILKHFL